MLCRATFLFRVLNALEASTSRAVSVLGSSNVSLMACMAASDPAW